MEHVEIVLQQLMALLRSKQWNSELLYHIYNLLQLYTYKSNVKLHVPLCMWYVHSNFINTWSKKKIDQNVVAETVLKSQCIALDCNQTYSTTLSCLLLRIRTVKIYVYNIYNPVHAVILSCWPSARDGLHL